MRIFSLLFLGSALWLLITGLDTVTDYVAFYADLVIANAYNVGGTIIAEVRDHRRVDVHVHKACDGCER